LFAVGLGVVLGVGRASAQAPVAGAGSDASVVVLGLRSLEGDDEFANNMTEALRGAAKTVEGWRMLERAVSMAQMTLAHNCEDIDAGCLSEIARGLEADRVVFGTVRRTAARSKYDYEITVSLFNGSTHTIAGTETQTIERDLGKQKKALAKQAQLLVTRLSASDANAGRLTVEVNVLNADVRLDGQTIGQTHDGKLTLDTVTPGEHTLEVSATGHQVHTQSINISPADQSIVSVTLERVQEQQEFAAAPEQATSALPEQESHSSLAWLGYTLIGVGAASAIAWGTSMYMIEFQYNRDATYKDYRNRYANRTLDACDAALSGDDAGSLDAGQLSDFQSRCRTGRTFQTLQWVFLGAAVVTSGVGAFVLISESGKSDRSSARRTPPTPRFALDPLIDRRNLALQATLRF
jgi:uncharacterized membrane protein